jgi:KaiC.
MEKRDIDVRWSLGLKLSTGFHKLDQMFEGGLKLGSLNFVTGVTSPARDRFLSELAINEMKRGYGVVYVTTDRPGKSIEKEIGIKIPGSTYNELLYVVDTISTMLEDRFLPPIRYLSRPNDFSNLDKVVENAFVTLKKRGIPQQVLIFDSIDKPLRLIRGYMNVYKILLAIQMLLEGYSVPGFCSIDPKMHSSMAVRSMSELASSFIVIDNNSNTMTTISGEVRKAARFAFDGLSFKIL